MTVFRDIKLPCRPASERSRYVALNVKAMSEPFSTSRTSDAHIDAGGEIDFPAAAQPERQAAAHRARRLVHGPRRFYGGCDDERVSSTGTWHAP